mmetsp:Transcript_7304/g.12358  ORF Transcript_7304/g.12358 Transcript_7304/m.12358 type:complete len:148 (-) Transcript_7304:298-741(-)
MTKTGKQYGHDFSQLSIVASNDINEASLTQLGECGHEIDVFGIGTNLVTCQAQPALGMVYKVVEFQGTPRMKFSEEMEKITLPGPKAVIRFYQNGQPLFDLLCLHQEVDSLMAMKESQNLDFYLSQTHEGKPESLQITSNISMEAVT